MIEYPDTVTIITGLIDSVDHNKMLIESYKNIKNKIISTWKTTSTDLIKQLEEAGFIIVLNNQPEIIVNKYPLQNPNYQLKTIYNALIKAGDLGYKYICRMRTDVFPTNHLLFLDVTRDLYQDKLTVICGCDLGLGPFYLDIQVSGYLPEMVKMFNKLKSLDDKRPSEIYIIEEYTKKTNLSNADIKLYLNYCLDRCINNNIEMIWFHPNEGVNYQRTVPYMKVINEYCKAFFIRT
jgi:hypothetical protein